VANEFQGVIDQLNQLDGDQMRQIQRKALRKVGEIVQTAVVAHAPEKAEGDGGLLAPGELKASIKARVHIASDEGIASGDSSRVAIGPVGNDAQLVANWVENGHVARRGKKKEGPPRFVPAYPFVRPAFDETQQAAIDAYTESVTADVQEAMK
jgi:hypothetical protein